MQYCLLTGNYKIHEDDDDDQLDHKQNPNFFVRKYETDVLLKNLQYMKNSWQNKKLN